MERESTIRGIIITAITGTITALLIAGATWFFPVLGAMLKSAAFVVWEYLSETTTLPRGVSLLLGIGGFLFVLQAMQRFLRVNFRERGYLEYRRDEVFGIVWRWAYRNGLVDDITPYCPSDDTMLIHAEQHQEPYGPFAPTVEYRCETCGRSFGPFPENDGWTRGKVARQIDRRIRTGEWRKPQTERGSAVGEAGSS